MLIRYYWTRWKLSVLQLSRAEVSIIDLVLLLDYPLTRRGTLAIHTYRSSITCKLSMCWHASVSNQCSPSLLTGSIVSDIGLCEQIQILSILVVKWCLDNSISSQVNMPCSPQDLSSALISALESNAVSPVAAPTGVRFDILLAEDNVVNQKLAVQILNKYGHQVEIAENGALAVDAFKQRIAEGHPFDIILVSTYLNHILYLADIR